MTPSRYKTPISVRLNNRLITIFDGFFRQRLNGAGTGTVNIGLLYIMWVLNKTQTLPGELIGTLIVISMNDWDPISVAVWSVFDIILSRSSPVWLIHKSYITFPEFLTEFKVLTWPTNLSWSNHVMIECAERRHQTLWHHEYQYPIAELHDGVGTPSLKQAFLNRSPN